MVKYIVKFCLLLHLARKINWLRFFRLFSAEADDIVWIAPSSMLELLAYIREQSALIHDLAIIKGLIDRGVPFRLHCGPGIGVFMGRNIHHTLSRAKNPFRLPDYTRGLFDAIGQLEAAGNRVFPSHTESVWWENKAYMYGRFRELGIPHPETRIVRRGDSLPETAFPVILKEVHSASSYGVFRISDREELAAQAGRIFGGGQEEFVLQKMVDMRCDLRVILIGDRVVSNYWRKNLSDEWRPTSTARGSAVDFGNFPERWRGFIVENFKKLGLRTGAFDITWEKDDITSAPLFLEVSPHYQPNPAPPPGCADMPYFEYKKKLFIRGPYYARYADLVFELKQGLYDVYFAEGRMIGGDRGLL